MINSRINGSGGLEVTYTVDCQPGNADYDLRVEFFVTDGDGPGATLQYLGYATWTTADYGAGSSTIVIPDAASLGVEWGDLIVATTTDELGNSSEVGTSTSFDEAIFADGFESGDTSAWH